MDDSIIKKLYGFVLEEDWESMKEILSEMKKKYKDESNDKDMMILLHPISVHKDNIIHLAVHSKKMEPLRQILDCVNPDMFLGFVTAANAYGNTVLHEAAICRNLEAVELLVKRNNELLRMKNDSGETPLFRAASYGNTKIVRFLAAQEDQWVTSYEGHRQLKDIHRKNNKGASIVRAAIQGKNFGTALVLLEMDNKLSELEDKYGSSLYYLLSKLSSVFKSRQKMPIYQKILYFLLPLGWGYNDEAENIETKDDDVNNGHFCKGLSSGSGRNFGSDNIEKEADQDMKVSYWIYLSIWGLIIAGLPVVRKIWENKRDSEFAYEVAKKLIENDKSLNQSTMPLLFQDRPLEVETEEEEEDEARGIPLFAAIRTGNLKCVKIILDKYPQALELVNHRKQNILHVAANYRQKKIFNYICEKKIPMLRLARQVDVKGYTILHSVADTQHCKEGTSTTSTDPAYQLREESEWFNRVEKIVPPYYTMRHAHSNKMTPWELFKIEHKEQHKEAQKGTKDISLSCFVITVLLAVFVFVTASTAPGGTVDSNGHSILLYKPIIMFFSVTDIVSLLCSLAAAVMFLTIHASPLKFKSFHWVDITLTFSCAFLFMSVATTMLKFTWTIWHIIRFKDHPWSRMNLACYTASFVVSMSASVYFPLFGSFLRLWTVIGFMFLRFLKFLGKFVDRHLTSKDKQI